MAPGSSAVQAATTTQAPARITAGLLAGATVAVLLFMINSAVKATGHGSLDVPKEVVAALTTIFTFVFSYWLD